jgi:predicted short-subunit dehydrogenase-like oxidoreductase (DUF2520 family)
MDIRSACVVGAGRVGKAVAARLAASMPTRVVGRDLDGLDADLVLLCVPDRAIAQVAAEVRPGPWIAHTSGACTLEALDPHRRRFSLHPLQTFTLERGPEQLDGAWAAVTAESPDGTETGFAVARILGLQPFALDDAARPLYHAGATVAAGFLATLHEVAAELMQAAGAPPEALKPLMRRTMENGFAPTGPHVRGDWETIERHLEAIREARPELEPLYRSLSEATAGVVSR